VINLYIANITLLKCRKAFSVLLVTEEVCYTDVKDQGEIPTAVG
jgi:hypothetical protein